MFALPVITLVQNSLFFGGLLSMLLSALILVTLYKWPMIWVGDAPPDLQSAAGDMSAADRRVKRVAGIAFLGIVLGILVAATIRLARLGSGELAFLDVVVSTFIILMTFNVVDLVLIDWLLIATIRPSFAMLPGTETMAGYSDYAFHFRGFVKGTVGIAVGSLIVAMIAIGFDRLFS